MGAVLSVMMTVKMAYLFARAVGWVRGKPLDVYFSPQNDLRFLISSSCFGGDPA